LGAKDAKLSRLIPKFHFCSVPLFREAPLINWTYTDAVLFTAYDVFRSHDFWLDEVVSSGATLKKALVDLGFPKNNSLVIDTGVFEMEAKKAGISQEIGIDVDIELTNAQIFEAYELSGADFFVAPDEIVLPTDKPNIIDEKIDLIKSNLLELLDIVPASQVVAVIQGLEQTLIESLLDFYRENGIRLFAAGGIIPLYKHDKEVFQKHLKYVRETTRDDWLHIFGLPRISLLSYYLHDLNVDSVDTSTITYLTKQRMYLRGLKPEPVRLAKFEECECPGCTILKENKSSRSPEFFSNLYIHNIVTAVKECFKNGALSSKPVILNTEDDSIARNPNSSVKPIEVADSGWMTADEVLRARKRG